MTSIIPPPEATKGISATSIMCLLVWAFTERDDLGEPFVALVAAISIVALSAVLVLNRRKK